MPIISTGDINRNKLMPLTLIVRISLSLESLPVDIRTATRFAMGRVYVNNAGIIKRKSLKTVKISTPLFITRSAILTRFPRSMTNVRTIRLRNSGPKYSRKK